MAADVYLDTASAAPMLDEARMALLDALDAFGDPLNIHAPGREGRRILDEARDAIASSIAAQADEIVFTSGGTEAVALAAMRTSRHAGGIRSRVMRSRVARSRTARPPWSMYVNPFFGEPRRMIHRSAIRARPRQVQVQILTFEKVP